MESKTTTFPTLYNLHMRQIDTFPGSELIRYWRERSRDPPFCPEVGQNGIIEWNRADVPFQLLEIRFFGMLIFHRKLKSMRNHIVRLEMRFRSDWDAWDFVILHVLKFKSD